ncbi:MAG: hypothetical protein KZQ90_00270 [Candidatus Thiodiazotropha sp. (ex Codakia rugifera)]|nr:hypothetical protein [Candidatus Thiodiazotropha sp. (ex Codakia rugifera)]
MNEGIPRDLLFYDETRWIANYMSDNYKILVREFYDFTHKVERETKYMKPHYVELSEYLVKCKKIIDKATDDSSDNPLVVNLPPVEVPYEHAVTLSSGVV